MTSDRGDFFGLTLDLRRQASLADHICSNIHQEGCFRHLSLNAVKFAQACRDGGLWRVLAQADCLSADGMGIVWAARLLGLAVPERVTGIDLMESLLPRFEAAGYSVFLLGARDDVLHRVQARLRRDFPELIMDGGHHGYDPDDSKLAEKVRASGADVVFVALPSPRKDAFVVNYGPKTGCRFIMGVGGAFDVLAGDIRRAPAMMQRCGLEFAWRIAMAPRTMGPRYGRGLWRFAGGIIPAILRAWAGRFYRAAGWVVTVGFAIWLVLTPADASGQVVLPPPEIEAAEANASQIMQFLTDQLSENDTVEIDDTVDALIARLLGRDVVTSEGNLGPEDFRMVLLALDRVLALTQMLMPGGTGSFLMELIVMKAVLRVVAMYPEPMMREAMAAGTMPEISRRFFDAGYRAQAVVSETTDNTSPGSISKPPQPFLPIRFSTYYRQWDPAATQSWNTSLTEERADTDQSDWIEQPSVSPR